MDNKQHNVELQNMFARGNLVSRLTDKETMYCAVFNFSVVPKPIDLVARAKVFVNDVTGENTQGLYETAFKESGLTDQSFSGFVVKMLELDLIKEKVEGLNLREAGVAAFVTDRSTVNRLLQEFPKNKFTFLRDANHKNMSEYTENLIKRYRQHSEEGLTVTCRHLDA